MRFLRLVPFLISIAFAVATSAPVYAAHDSISACGTTASGTTLFNRNTAASGTTVYGTIEACIQNGVAAIAGNSCMTHYNFSALPGGTGTFELPTMTNTTDATCTPYHNIYAANYSFTRLACVLPEVRNTSTGLCACPVGSYHDTPDTCVPDPCAGQPAVTNTYATTSECLSSVPGAPTCAPDKQPSACGDMVHNSPNDCTQSVDLLSCSATYVSPSTAEQQAPGTGSAAPPAPPSGGGAITPGTGYPPAPPAAIDGTGTNPADPCIAAGTCQPINGTGVNPLDPCIATSTCSGTSTGGTGTIPPPTVTDGGTGDFVGAIDGTGYMTDMSSNRDGFKTRIQSYSDSASDGFQTDKLTWLDTFQFSPVASTCAPYTGSVHGVNVSINICTYTEYLRDLLAWLFALFAAWSIYGVVFRAKS